MTIQEKAIEQLERISEHLSSIGEKEDYTDIAIKALEQQPNRCDSCTHSEEQDGSNCYECVKGMSDNFEPQPKTGYIFINVNKLAKEVAEKALDEITYEGKTIKEWAEIIVNQQPSEDCISREQALLALTGMDLPTDRDKLIALFTERIQHLPPVTPERPKGKWIHWTDDYKDYCTCSKCGYGEEGELLLKNITPFCPYCGSYNGGGEDEASD